MRRDLVRAGLRVRFLARRMPVVLALIAAGLTAWVFELGAVLQGQALVRNWSTVWVGLDLMEITGLVLTALLLRRRSAYLGVVAAVTATLFALDAWFDVLTAAAGADWYESLAAAFCAEVPLAGLLAAIALWATRHCLGASEIRGSRSRSFPGSGACPGGGLRTGGGRS